MGGQSRADASKKSLFPGRSENEQKEAKPPLLRRNEARADGWCRENPKKCASRCRVSGLRIATAIFLDIILRNQLLSSSVASCVATAEARFLRAGKENGTFCAKCTQVHEQQKAPDDAASTQKAGFDGSSRQIRDLQNLELDASALGPRAARVYGRGLLPYDKSVARHAEIAPGRVVFYLKGLPPWMMLAAKR